MQLRAPRYHRNKAGVQLHSALPVKFISQSNWSGGQVKAFGDVVGHCIGWETSQTKYSTSDQGNIFAHVFMPINIVMWEQDLTLYENLFAQ